MPYQPENPPQQEAVTLDTRPRLHRYPGFRSGFLPDGREISVYLPSCYFDEPQRRFAAFYLHDGQNLFDPGTSFVPGQTWQIHTSADRLAMQGVTEPVILVGIANTGERRMAEYTPTADPKLGGGQGTLYARLLVEELKPFIDRNYRTLPGPEHTGLGGASLGALISLWTGLHYPGIFGRLAALSPSLWWDRRSLFAEVERLSPEPRPRIWLDIGLLEGAKHLRNTEAFARLLRRRGWEAQNLHFLRAAGGIHAESAWAERFPQALRFLFPA